LDHRERTGSGLLIGFSPFRLYCRWWCLKNLATQIQAFFALADISRHAADRLMVALIDEIESWRSVGSMSAA
jgi:hypothetical protein